MSGYPRHVKLVEVGPRDGLQNEPSPVETGAKVDLIDRLSCTGLRTIEATSFVSPKWVPQLADAEEVLKQITRREGVVYPVLVPNMSGLERALSVHAEEIAVFTAVSETFSQKNTNCSIAESIERFKPVIARAHAEKLRVRAYISCVLGCPYEGAIDVARVAELAQQLYQELLDRYGAEQQWGNLARLRLGALYERQQEWGQALQAYQALLDTAVDPDMVRRARQRIAAIEVGRVTPKATPGGPAEG